MLGSVYSLLIFFCLTGEASNDKKEKDDIELFNKYFLKWKNAKQKDNPSAAIPRFYYKVRTVEAGVIPLHILYSSKFIFNYLVQ